MKKTIRKITPLILLAFYSVIAGGSLVSLAKSFLIGASAGIGLCILSYCILTVVFTIKEKKENKKKRDEGLANAQDIFGRYTSIVEYKLGQYILYDEDTHRILLNGSVVDSRKLNELKITERAPQTRVTYRDKQVTKKNIGSELKRTLVGGLVAGPLGAIVGGATAKTETETTRVPEQHVITGWYTIDVIDTEGKERAKYHTDNLDNHERLKSFLNKIIDANHEPERIAQLLKEEEDRKAIQAMDMNNVTVGTSRDCLDTLLINSTQIIERDTKVYVLSLDVVAKINEDWLSRFEKVSVSFENNQISRIVGLSDGYAAWRFNDLVNDSHMLVNKVSAQYGEPVENPQEISYTCLSDDNNRLKGYLWRINHGHTVKIDYIYDRGQYKYEYDNSTEL